MSRIQLQTILENLLGTKEVYFQPPNKIKMHYPAIVYYLDRIDTRSADDNHYFMKNRYGVIFMTRDADSDIPAKILAEFPMSTYDRSARNENVYHHYLTLYY